MAGGIRGLIGAAAGVLVGLLVSGCPQSATFSCQTDDQCLAGDQAGQCTEAGYCAFEDEECESGWAYGELAAEGLAGTCVTTGGSGTGPSSGTGDSGTTMVTSVSATGPGTMTTVDDTGPPPDCFEPDVPCQPEDPCAAAGACDGAGNCVPTEMIECGSPPGPCYVPAGECLDGECLYVPQSREFPCDDGNPCTFEDRCDGNGGCDGGPECPASDPCIISSVCGPGGCMTETMPEGTECGMEPALRCCSGACVNISLDDDHCGGCGMECDGSEDCVPLEAIGLCNRDPGVSGRCTCEGDGICPNGQGCIDLGGLTGLCEPTADDQCTSSLFLQMDCPNYCAY